MRSTIIAAFIAAAIKLVIPAAAIAEETGGYPLPADEISRLLHSHFIEGTNSRIETFDFLTPMYGYWTLQDWRGEIRGKFEIRDGGYCVTAEGKAAMLIGFPPGHRGFWGRPAAYDIRCPRIITNHEGQTACIEAPFRNPTGLGSSDETIRPEHTCRLVRRR